MSKRISRRNLQARCASHPLPKHRLRKSIRAPNVYFCPNRGTAHTATGGSFLRPSRFEAVYNTATLNSTLLTNMILRQGVHHPRSQRYVNFGLRAEALKELHQLSVQFGLQHSTFARAVALYDYYISITPPETLDYTVVLRTTLNLASKLSESERRCFTASQLAGDLEGRYHTEVLGRWEVRIFSALGWTLNVVTAHDFANFFLWQGVAGEWEMNRLARGNNILAQALVNCLEALVTYILDLALLEYGFYRFTPLGMAASAVALARKAIGLPHWTSELKQITDLDLGKHDGCLKLLAAFIEFKDSGVIIHDAVRRTFAGEVGLSPVRPTFVPEPRPRPAPQPNTPAPVEEDTSGYAPMGTEQGSPLSIHRSPVPQVFVPQGIAIVSIPFPCPPFHNYQVHRPTPRAAGLPRLRRLAGGLRRTGPRGNRIREMRH